MRAGDGAGSVVGADPAAVRSASAALDAAAARLLETAVAREGAGAFQLDRVWAGPAAQAAAQESGLLARGVTEAAGRLGEAARALASYAVALEVARADEARLAEREASGETAFRLAVAGLAAAAAEPWQAERLERDRAADATRLQAERGASLDRLRVAGDAAAAALARLTSAALPESCRLTAPGVGGAGPEAGGRVVGAGMGGSDRFWLRVPPDDVLRAALLAGLPLTAGEQRARAAADRLVALAPALATIRSGATDHAGGAMGPGSPAYLAALDDVSALARDVEDPYLALALMHALGADGLGEVMSSLAQAAPATFRSVDPVAPERIAAVVDTIATGFVVATNPAFDAGLDAATAASSAQWRGTTWLPGLLAAGAATAATSYARSPGAGTFWVQTELIRAAARRGPAFRPGAGYLVAALPAMAALEHRAGPLAQAPVPLIGYPIWDPTGSAPSDPLDVGLRALRDHPGAARQVLLREIAPGGPTVVEHLVVGRMSTHAPGPPAWRPPSNEALGAVIGPATTGSDREAVVLAARFLDAYGRAAEQVPELDAPTAGWRSESMQGLRASVADLLVRYEDSLWVALRPVGAAAEGAAAEGAAGPDLVHRTNDGVLLPDLVGPDRVRAVIADLARDGVVPGGEPVPPVESPAVQRVLAAVVTQEQERVVSALRPPDPAAGPVPSGAGGTSADAAISRFGHVVGFTVASASVGLEQSQRAVDVAHQQTRDLSDRVLGRATIPPPLALTPTGKVASQVLKAVVPLVEAAVEDAHPVDGEAQQRALDDVSLDRQRAALEAVGVDVVSRARPWPAQLDPARWAEATGRAAFHAPDGAPLPLAEMGAAQLDSFRAWSAGVPAYDVVPAEVADALERGVREATHTTARHA